MEMKFTAPGCGSSSIRIPRDHAATAVATLRTRPARMSDCRINSPAAGTRRRD